MEKLDDKKLAEIAEKTTVFARLSPEAKERIVKALQSNGRVVGYLGDGINDAPTLKASDVGISVNNAVDIAKESAGIILMRPSLTVLQDGVMEGRRVFCNIEKYLKMGASSNLGNMISVTGASIFLPFLPMAPVQILLNNFLYDASQEAIPTDNVDAEYLSKPRQWSLGAISSYMLFMGPLSSIFDFVTFGVLLFVFKAPVALFHTAWFVESLLTQALVIHIIRTDRIPLLQSRPSRLLALSTLAIACIGIALPFTALGASIGFVPLSKACLAAIAAIVAAYLAAVWLAKGWYDRRNKMPAT